MEHETVKVHRSYITAKSHMCKHLVGTDIYGFFQSHILQECLEMPNWDVISLSLIYTDLFFFLIGPLAQPMQIRSESGFTIYKGTIIKLILLTFAFCD